jgi:methionyl-tRNA formyltransferase
VSGLPLRTVFLGSDPIALPVLDWLRGAGREVAEVVGVVTQPDRPAGRGRRTEPGPIKRWAINEGLPVLQPEKLSAETREMLAAWKPDLALVFAYGHLLREEFIQLPRLGTLNLHASLLPRYRGASPIQTAIACGERRTGVSLMRIVRALDAGPVAETEEVDIGLRDTATEVEARLAGACVPLLARSLPRLADGRLVFRDQDPTAVSYCRRLEKTDGTLDFSETAGVVAGRINGLNPWPGCTVVFASTPLRIGRAVAISEGLGGVAAAPGTVLGWLGDGLTVATGSGGVNLLELQRPGGRMLPAAEFLRGFPIPEGARLPSQPMSPLVSPRPFPTRRAESETRPNLNG